MCVCVCVCACLRLSNSKSRELMKVISYDDHMLLLFESKFIFNANSFLSPFSGVGSVNHVRMTDQGVQFSDAALGCAVSLQQLS